MVFKVATASGHITWELARNATSWAPPQTYRMTNTRGRGSALCVLTGPLRDAGVAKENELFVSRPPNLPHVTHSAHWAKKPGFREREVTCKRWPQGLKGNKISAHVTHLRVISWGPQAQSWLHTDNTYSFKKILMSGSLPQD